MADNRAGSSLLKSEDWMAVWLGFLIIAAILAGMRPQMPSFRWATDGEFATTVAENKAALEKLIKEAEAKGEAELIASATALKTAMDGGDRKAIGDASKKFGAAGKKAKSI